MAELSLPGTDLAQIRTFDNPTLRARCADISDFGDATARLARRLIRALDREPNGAGLAANQIGIGLRAFAYDLRYRGEDLHGVIFNPEVVEDRGTAWYEEGCLSIPDFFWPVGRADEVVVRGYDSAGKPMELELSEIGSRLFQHEIDHLDGLLIFDRIESKRERREALDEATDLLQQHQAGFSVRKKRRSRRIFQ